MTTFSTDSALFLFTSLTAGSSHIVTATSRLETILRANRVPFKAIDVATNEKARMLWGRRAGKDEGGRLRKLPGLVQEGFVLGDLVEIEDWNEYGELKQHVKIYYDEQTIPSIHDKPPDPPKPKRKPVAKKAASPATPAPPAPPTPAAGPPKPSVSADRAPEAKSRQAEEPMVLSMRSVADEAAQKAKDLRLRTLREKLYGKNPKPADSAQSPGSSETAALEVKAVDKTAPTSGLQSPMSGTWGCTSTTSIDHGEVLQNPATGYWGHGHQDVGTLQNPPPTDATKPGDITGLEESQGPATSYWEHGHKDVGTSQSPVPIDATKPGDIAGLEETSGSAKVSDLAEGQTFVNTEITQEGKGAEEAAVEAHIDDQERTKEEEEVPAQPGQDITKPPDTTVAADKEQQSALPIHEGRSERQDERGQQLGV